MWVTICFVVVLDGIVKYMRSKAGPAFKKLESVEAVETFLAKPEIAIVGQLLTPYNKI